MCVCVCVCVCIESSEDDRLYSHTSGGILYIHTIYTHKNDVSFYLELETICLSLDGLVE